MLVLNKKFKILLLSLFFCICFNIIPAFSAEQPIAKLVDFSGTVLIYSRGSWAVKPVKNLVLYSMDRVVTRIGNATIYFNDGATLNIKRNSNLLIQEREEKKGLTQKARIIVRRVLLFLGKMNFRTGTSEIETRFETTKTIIGIRGTAGILSIGADGRTYILFTEGGAKYILGDFVKGVAKDIVTELADQNPVQRATFVAKAAADQVRRTEKKVLANEMPQVQLALAMAIADEAAALEVLTHAESLLISPDKEVIKWAELKIFEAKEAIKAAKEAQRKAIKDGADPAFKGFSPDDPGFDVPSEPLIKKSET
jgi:hypothetical protein